MMIEPKHKKTSISRQCDLIGLTRASYYYAPKGDDGYNQQMMNLIDEQFTKTPFYGVPWGQSQAHSQADAQDGIGGDLSEEEIEQGPPGT